MRSGSGRRTKSITGWGNCSGRRTGEYRQAMLNARLRSRLLPDGGGLAVADAANGCRVGDEVMDVRAGRWPVLRVAYWLSRWLIRRVGRALTDRVGRSKRRRACPRLNCPVPEPKACRPGGVSLRSTADRALASCVNCSFASVFPTRSSLPGNRAGPCRTTPERGRGLIGRLTTGYKPAWGKRLFVWLVLFWFPVCPTHRRGHVEMAAAGTHITDWMHGLYRLVWALGAINYSKACGRAGHLHRLSGAIYARCVQDVQKARRKRTRSR